MGSLSLRNEILQAAATTYSLSDLSDFTGGYSHFCKPQDTCDLRSFFDYRLWLRRTLLNLITKALDSSIDVQVDGTFLAKGKRVWKECQLFRFYHALIDYFLHGHSIDEPLIQVASGATPIEAEGWLSWLNAPLAGLHEELGMLVTTYGFFTNNQKLLAKGKKQLEWQKQLLDPSGLPIEGLFATEGKDAYKLQLAFSYNYYLIGAWVYNSGDLLSLAEKAAEKLREQWDAEVEELLSMGLFLLGLVRKSLAAPVKQSQRVTSAMCDPHSELIGRRFGENYGYASLCGGSSGLGSYGMSGVKLITWGPQISSLGNCEGFGVYSPLYHPYKKQSYTSLSTADEGFKITGNVKVAARRATNLESATINPFYSEWFRVSQVYSKEGIDLSWSWLKSSNEIEQKRYICFYIKAKDCQLAASKRRVPLRSLEHYFGDAEPVLFNGFNGKILFSPSEKTSMDLIPLSGEGDFWGADYLLSLHAICHKKMTAKWSVVD